VIFWTGSSFLYNPRTARRGTTPSIQPSHWSDLLVVWSSKGIEDDSTSATSSSSTTKTTISLLEEIRSMRVKELKAELATLQISTQDVFEKKQLVERLYQARTTTTTTKRNSPTTKKDNSPPASTTQQQQSQQRANSQKKNVIRAPLYFTSMEEDLRIAAVNMDGGGITVNGSDKPYSNSSPTEWR
jgi:hypothetical protein